METENPQPGARPEARIQELVELLASDWKRTGSDQRFFQYVENLRHRLSLPTDPYNVEDTDLISRLRETAPPSGS